MGIVLVVALSALIYTLIILLKNLSAQQWRPAATQVLAWIAGIGGVFVVATTELGGGITIGGLTLDRLDSWSKVLLGVLAASLASMLHEFKKAIDRTDTSAVPDWFEPKDEAAQRAHLVLPTSVATPEAVAAARLQVTSGHTTPSTS